MAASIQSGDLVTAAVVLEDDEWFDYRFELGKLAKDRVQGAVIAALGGILEAGLQAPEDIERAIARMGELAVAIMRVPPESHTIHSYVLRPPPSPSPAQQRLMDRVTNHILPELMQARRRKDESAVKALADELHEIGPALFPPARADDDLEVVRSVFGAYVAVYRSWFDRREWLGQHVPKSSAYYLIDSVAGAPGPRAIREVVMPMLSELAGALTDDEVQSAVLASLHELEEELESGT